MHKKRNRLIAALLTLAMCLSVISPLSAFAADDDVAQIGDGLKVSSLATALDYAKAKDTVKLLADVALDADLTIDKEVTLDLNGKTLTLAADKSIKVTSGGNLTVKGTTGEIKATAESTAALIAVSNGGSFTLEGGTIDATPATAATAVTFAVGASDKPNTITVTGGTIKAASYAISGTAEAGETDASTVTISGGEISSANEYAIYAPSHAAISISGGTIFGSTAVDNTNVRQTKGVINATYKDNVSITGGTFNEFDATLVSKMKTVVYEASASNPSDASTVVYTAQVEAHADATAPIVRLNQALTLGNLWVNNSSNVTYDLNGYDLTYDGSKYKNASNVEYGFGVNTNCILTIKDGTKSGTERTATFKYTGSHKGSGGNVVFNTAAGATIIASNVKFEFGDAGGFFPLGTATAVTLTACDVKATGYGVGTNSEQASNGGIVVTLKDTKIESTDVAVMINVPGTLNVENCTLTGSRLGAFVRAGTATFKNTVIETTGNGDASQNRTSWGQGTYVPVAALLVGSTSGDAQSYAANAIVTLQGVTLETKTSNKYPALYVTANSTYKSKVTFTNSTINGDIIEDANNLGDSLATQISVTIDDDTADNITGLTQAIPTRYLPAGYEQNASSFEIVNSSTMNVKNGVLYLNGTAVTEEAKNNTVTVTEAKELHPGDTLAALIKPLFQEQTVTWSTSDANKASVAGNGNSATITAVAATASDTPVVITAKAKHEKNYEFKVNVTQIATSWSASGATAKKVSGNQSEVDVASDKIPQLTVTDTSAPAGYADAVEALNTAIAAADWQTYGLKDVSNSGTVTILPKDVVTALKTDGNTKTAAEALSDWIATLATTQAEKNALVRYALPTELPTASVTVVADAPTSGMSYIKGEDAEATIANAGKLELTYNETATVKFTLPEGTYKNATVTWAVATADADKGVVTVTDNNNGTATIKATKADTTGVSVVATLSVADEPALTTSQSITVKVAKQTPTVAAAITDKNSTAVTIVVDSEKTDAQIQEELQEKFTFTATDLYDENADLKDEGTWAISAINATDSTGVATATVTFTPGEDSNYNSAEISGGIEWTKVVPLKLDVNATNVKKTGDTYTGLVITITSDVESAQTALTTLTESNAKALSDIVDSLGESWKASSKGNLYPTAPAEGATYGEENKTIINPTTLVEYVNSELAKISGLDAIYRVTAAPAAPKVSDSSQEGGGEQDGQQGTETVRDDSRDGTVDYNELKATTGDGDNATATTLATAIGTDDATLVKSFDLFKTESTEDTALTVEKVQDTILQEAAKQWGLDYEIDSTDEDSNKIIASAIHDVTYKDEDGNNITTLDGKIKVYLPYPTGSTGKEGHYIVAHLVMHDEKSANYGKIEYLPIVDQDEAGVYVYMTSLSLVSVAETEQQVVVAPTISGDASGEKKTETGDTGAAAKKDNTGTIIVVGAVAVAAVVGGVIAYNWDKLPVHKIEGTVVDANGAAVANATVTLTKDGKVVKTLTTDANGYYSAKVAKGEYEITAIVGESTATAAGSTGAAAQLAIA